MPQTVAAALFLERSEIDYDHVIYIKIKLLYQFHQKAIKSTHFMKLFQNTPQVRILECTEWVSLFLMIFTPNTLHICVNIHTKFHQKQSIRWHFIKKTVIFRYF